MAVGGFLRSGLWNFMSLFGNEFPNSFSKNLYLNWECLFSEFLMLEIIFINHVLIEGKSEFGRWGVGVDDYLIFL